jgi:hypothetical protein
MHSTPASARNARSLARRTRRLRNSPAQSEVRSRPLAPSRVRHLRPVVLGPAPRQPTIAGCRPQPQTPARQRCSKAHPPHAAQTARRGSRAETSFAGTAPQCAQSMAGVANREPQSSPVMRRSQRNSQASSSVGSSTKHVPGNGLCALPNLAAFRLSRRDTGAHAPDQSGARQQTGLCTGTPTPLLRQEPEALQPIPARTSSESPGERFHRQSAARTPPKKPTRARHYRPMRPGASAKHPAAALHHAPFCAGPHARLPPRRASPPLPVTPAHRLAPPSSDRPKVRCAQPRLELRARCACAYPSGQLGPWPRQLRAARPPCLKDDACAARCSAAEREGRCLRCGGMRGCCRVPPSHSATELKPHSAALITVRAAPVLFGRRRRTASCL